MENLAVSADGKTLIAMLQSNLVRTFPASDTKSKEQLFVLSVPRPHPYRHQGAQRHNSLHLHSMFLTLK